MRTHYLIAAAASAAMLGLVACTTTTSGQQDWQVYLDGGALFYKAYCIQNTGSTYCTAEAAKKAADAYKAAQKAIAAYNAGTVDIAAVQAAIAAAFKLFADFKG